jgi:hypothetical protein
LWGQCEKWDFRKIGSSFFHQILEVKNRMDDNNNAKSAFQSNFKMQQNVEITIYEFRENLQFTGKTGLVKHINQYSLS